MRPSSTACSQPGINMPPAATQRRSGSPPCCELRRAPCDRFRRVGRDPRAPRASMSEGSSGGVVQVWRAGHAVGRLRAPPSCGMLQRRENKRKEGAGRGMRGRRVEGRGRDGKGGELSGDPQYNKQKRTKHNNTTRNNIKQNKTRGRRDPSHKKTNTNRNKTKQNKTKQTNQTEQHKKG